MEDGIIQNKTKQKKKMLCLVAVALLCPFVVSDLSVAVPLASFGFNLYLLLLFLQCFSSIYCNIINI